MRKGVQLIGFLLFFASFIYMWFSKDNEFTHRLFPLVLIGFWLLALTANFKLTLLTAVGSLVVLISSYFVSFSSGFQLAISIAGYFFGLYLSGIKIEFED